MSQEKKSRIGLKEVVLVVLGGLVGYLLLQYIVAMQRERNLKEEVNISSQMHVRELEEVQRRYDRGNYTFEEARDRIDKLSDDRRRENERMFDRYRK